MVLQIPGEPDEILKSIFPHSNRFETGGGKERPGQATVVVSLDGKGDTDDIRDAIELLPPTGGLITIKEGTYIISSFIDVDKNNVTIEGVGDGTVIKLKQGFPDDVAAFKIQSQSNIVLRDFKIDGDASQVNTEMHGIETSSSSTFIRIENITIVNMEGGTGVKTNGGSNVTITNCNITGVAESTFDGISISTTTEVIISNNQIINCTGDGIRINSGQGMTIIGNVCKDNNIMGIDIVGAVGGGADLVNRELTISGNVCTGNGDDGISVLRYNRSTIIGNISTDNGAYGIDIGSVADRLLISGNITLGNTSGQIRDAGSNTLPNGAMGTTNLALDDLNIVA